MRGNRNISDAAPLERKGRARTCSPPADGSTLRHAPCACRAQLSRAGPALVHPSQNNHATASKRHVATGGPHDGCVCTSTASIGPMSRPRAHCAHRVRGGYAARHGMPVATATDPCCQRNPAARVNANERTIAQRPLRGLRCWRAACAEKPPRAPLGRAWRGEADALRDGNDDRRRAVAALPPRAAPAAPSSPRAAAAARPAGCAPCQGGSSVSPSLPGPRAATSGAAR